MRRKFHEWLSIQLAKNPGRIVLFGILVFNILFLFFSAFLISRLSLTGTENMRFLDATFYTITMILDAGCISFVVEDIGTSGVLIAVICLAIIMIGMISFTGAVIGYVTNYISSFIENANERSGKIKLYNHNVILNWNTRASEIVNDLLYCNEKKKVVVLVNNRKEEIEKEIEERLSDTVARENKAVREACKDKSALGRWLYFHKNKFKRRVTVIVKEGDVFSARQLHDISLEYAKSVVILGSDINNSGCRFEQIERTEVRSRGNSQTVKTLMQVADITADASSLDNQKIIVEITDEWTWDLVAKIIKSKQVDGKCNIVPVRVNKILGQILSQFSLMPELNFAYRELFSNKGAAFFAKSMPKTTDDEFIRTYMANHKHAIPLTMMESVKKGKNYAYFSAISDKSIEKESVVNPSDYKVDFNYDYWIERKNVIILGHNSKVRDIMEGFASFQNEWDYKDSDDHILQIIVIDDQKSLEKENNYVNYPFVVKTVAASIYDRDLICDTIRDFVKSNKEDTSVLILSDDEAPNEQIDANALANLVYVQDIIRDMKADNDAFDEESVDVIVEIVDPKHHDIVSSYSVNNVVISNRYISKMITQIGQKEVLFDFYTDILTYDEDTEDGTYESKEIYTKKVSRLFNTIPAPCKADEFIRAVYNASVDPSLPKEKQNQTIALGYVKPGGKMILFEGNQEEFEVKLEKRDKLIVFSNH